MTKWIITYHVNPYPDVVVDYIGATYEDAVRFARQFRHDSFSIEKA